MGMGSLRVGGTVRGGLFGVLIRLGDGGAGVAGGSVGLFSFLHIHVRVGFLWSVFMSCWFQIWRMS